MVQFAEVVAFRLSDPQSTSKSLNLGITTSTVVLSIRVQALDAVFIVLIAAALLLAFYVLA